jgi:hypothetical protein
MRAASLRVRGALLFQLVRRFSIAGPAFSGGS